MNIALVLCPSWDALYPLASFALLGARLKSAGHDAKVLDLNHAMARLEMAAGGDELRPRPTPADPWTEPEFVRDRALEPHRAWISRSLRTLLGEGRRLFGFSVFNSNLAFTLEVARLLKSLDPAAVVVLGGPSCLTFPECLEHLKHDCVDAVVLGEADESFPRLVDRFAVAGGLVAGPGVLLRGDSSTWRDASAPPADLDALPMLDYSVYGSLETYAGKVISTSRGCVRECVFCADWREMRYRRMSGRRIHAELMHQLERHPGKTDFLFGDSIVNSSIEELEDFARRAIASNAGATWSGYAIVRPDMSRPHAELLKTSGCRRLYFGIESGSQRVLRSMRKPIPPEVNARVLRDASSAGIETSALWMAGFPTETEETFLESLRFIRENAAGIGLLLVSLFSIAEMRGLAEEYGLGSVESDLFWDTRDGLNTFPVRLGRLRRLMETADEAGIRCLYQGRIGLSELPAYEERLLERWRAYSGSRR